MKLRLVFTSRFSFAINRMIKMLHRVKGRDKSKLRLNFLIQFTVQSIVRFNIAKRYILGISASFGELIFLLDAHFSLLSVLLFTFNKMLYLFSLAPSPLASALRYLQVLKYIR